MYFCINRIQDYITGDIMKPIKLVQIHYEDGTSEKIFSEGINKTAFNVLSAKVRQRIINQDPTTVPHILGGPVSLDEHFSDGVTPKLSEKINAVRITPNEKEFLKHSGDVCQITESELIRCMITDMANRSNYNAGGNATERKDGIIAILAPYLWNDKP